MRKIVVCLILIVASAQIAIGADKSSDLEAYIAQIRESGMSEWAKNSIQMVAHMMTGSTLLSYQKNEANGLYSTRYSAAFCPSPEMNEVEIERIRARDTAKVDSLLPTLRFMADGDKSGFVSTEEGVHFRDLVEFGYKVAHVVREEGRDKQKVCAAMGMTEERFDANVREYRALLDQSRQNDIELPELGL